MHIKMKSDELKTLKDEIKELKIKLEKISKEKEEFNLLIPFQSFAPFENTVEGFSFSRVLTNPKENIEDEMLNSELKNFTSQPLHSYCGV